MVNNTTDPIVEKETKKKKIVAILGVIGIICICVILAFIIRGAIQKKTYESALSAETNEDYATAISLFKKLSDYKDSSTHLSYLTFTQDFLISEAYESIQNEIINETENLCSQYNISFQPSEKVLIVNCQLPENWQDSVLSPNVEFFNYLVSIENTFCSLSNVINKTAENSNFQITNIINLNNSNGEVLYSVKDGIVIPETAEFYNNVKTKLIEPIYNQMVSLVEAGKYQEACDYWSSNNQNGHFDLGDYADLSDYYYYAFALKDYIKKERFTPRELIDIDDIFEKKISSDFKDAPHYREILFEIVSNVIGEYSHNFMIIGDGSGYRWYNTVGKILIADNEAAYITEIGISTRYGGASDPSTVTKTGVTYKPILVIKNDELQCIELLDKKTEKLEYALTLNVNGSAINATRAGEKNSLVYYKSNS